MLEFNVITPVAVEPLTLAEVKEHIRQTSGTFAGDLATSQSIAPGGHAIIASYGLHGAAVDVLGKIAVVNLNAGACGTGGSVAAKIQESDDDDVYEDFTDGAFTLVTAANDNAVQEIEYTGGKQYIRVVATVAGAICEFSADIMTKTGAVNEDNFLTGLIKTAREYCEGYTGRALAEQTLEAYLDCFPSDDKIELPRPPLVSITSVKYFDYTGAETTLTVTTDYIVDDLSDVGGIVLPYGGTWPTATLYPLKPIRIKYKTGYTSLKPIPQSIKQAMLLLIGHWNENREAVMTGAINMTKVIEFAVTALLSQHKVFWFG